ATAIVDREQVDVDASTNGARRTPSAISGERGSGVICLNGAAARLINVGDLVIICSYAEFSEEERLKHVPKTVLVNRKNQIGRKRKVL
ncbi:MAG: aspartate 1-decarboxylase, partial [Planctomyces sp.]